MRLCCIIKPPALHRANAILRAFSRERFVVLEVQWIRLTPFVLATLYDHMNIAAQTAITERYGGRTAIAILLSAPGIDSVLEVIGRDSDPAACEPGTLRYRYGQHAAADYVGDGPWWENAIHRPVDERERRRDLALLFPDHMYL